MLQQLLYLWLKSWRSIFEIILLSVVLYYGYLYFRGTRGAKVLTGLAIVFLTLTLISTAAEPGRDRLDRPEFLRLSWLSRWS